MGDFGSPVESSIEPPTSPASIPASLIVSAASSGDSPNPSSRSAATGRSVASAMSFAFASVSSRVTEPSPSCFPMVKARPALVVVSASNPRPARIFAVPASQGFGMTKMPGRLWSAWNRRPFSAWVTDMRIFLSGGTTIEQQPHSKSNKHDAGDTVQTLRDTRTFEPPRQGTRGEDEHGEPHDAFQRMNAGERHGEPGHGGAGGDELREQGDVENTDLGIQQIGEESPGEPIRPAPPPRLNIEARRRAGEEPDAEVDEVGRTGQAEDVVGQAGHGEEPAESDRSGESPNEAAQAHTQPGEERAAAPVDGGGPEYQGGVESRCDRQESRRGGERDKRWTGGHGRKLHRVRLPRLQRGILCASGAEPRVAEKRVLRACSGQDDTHFSHYQKRKMMMIPDIGSHMVSRAQLLRLHHGEPLSRAVHRGHERSAAARGRAQAETHSRIHLSVPGDPARVLRGILRSEERRVGKGGSAGCA